MICTEIYFGDMEEQHKYFLLCLNGHDECRVISHIRRLACL